MTFFLTYSIYALINFFFLRHINRIINSEGLKINWRLPYLAIASSLVVLLCILTLPDTAQDILVKDLGKNIFADFLRMTTVSLAFWGVYYIFLSIFASKVLKRRHIALLSTRYSCLYFIFMPVVYIWVLLIYISYSGV